MELQRTEKLPPAHFFQVYIKYRFFIDFKGYIVYMSVKSMRIIITHIKKTHCHSLFILTLAPHLQSINCYSIY